MTAQAAEIPRPRGARSMGLARPFLVAAVGAAIVVIGYAIPFSSSIDRPNGELFASMSAVAAVSACWVAAAFVAAAADQSSRMWPLFLAYVLGQWLWALTWVPDSIVWTLGDLLGNTVGGLVFAHILVAYPSGRARSRFDRRLLVGVYAIGTSLAFAKEMTYATHFPCQPVCIRNVLAVWPDDALYAAFGVVNAIAVPVIGVFVVASVVRHWRDAGAVGRRALVPALVVLPFAYVLQVAGYVGDNLGIQALSDFSRQPIGILTNAIVPIGLMVGIVRARLGRGRVADLLLELDRGVPLGGLEDVLARALRDPSLRLAYPAPDGGGLFGTDGQPYVAPPANDPRRSVTTIERGGAVLAIIDHDRAVDAESPGLAEAVGSAARLALENERLAAEVRAQLEEVRASRTRIAEAADDERRRMERDLHDGAQQRLVALTMRLEQARESAATPGELIDATTAELRAAIDEVRQLARGVHPPVLAERGLAAALESLAERAPLPTTVRVPGGRFPASIERAAYFVTAEALTNSARHAHARGVTIAGSSDGDVLVVTIEDDGDGGADAAAGTGLRGLHDRVAAVGGTLEMTSAEGAGTRLRAVFPLR